MSNCKNEEHFNLHFTTSFNSKIHLSFVLQSKEEKKNWDNNRKKLYMHVGYTYKLQAANGEKCIHDETQTTALEQRVWVFSPLQCYLCVR